MTKIIIIFILHNKTFPYHFCGLPYWADFDLLGNRYWTCRGNLFLFKMVRGASCFLNIFWIMQWSILYGLRAHLTTIFVFKTECKFWIHFVSIAMNFCWKISIPNYRASKHHRVSGNVPSAVSKKIWILGKCIIQSQISVTPFSARNIWKRLIRILHHCYLKLLDVKHL